MRRAGLRGLGVRPRCRWQGRGFWYSRFFGVEIGDELRILRLEHRFAAAFGFDANFVAAQRSLGFRQIRFAARSLRRKTLLVRNGLFHVLLRGGVRCQQRFLPGTLGAGAHNVSVHRVDSRLGGDYLRLGLIDSCERLIDARILQIALFAIVLDGRFRGFHRGGGLGELGLVVIVLEIDEQVQDLRLHACV